MRKSDSMQHCKIRFELLHCCEIVMPLQLICLQIQYMTEVSSYTHELEVALHRAAIIAEGIITKNETQIHVNFGFLLHSCSSRADSIDGST
jgi:hypothetical protein